MNLPQFGVTLLAAALFASGCSSAGRPKPFGVDGTGREVGGFESNKFSQGLNGASGKATQPLAPYSDNTAGPLAQHVIYFVYDSFEVQPEYLTIVKNHASYLAANQGKSVVLEGHADERGSPEYNIALGEQRARSVAKLMKLQGVGENQIHLVSYGEEKAAVSGHDENAWQQNRRVEITYQEP